MTHAEPPPDTSNPFSSRCVRPGAIPFLFPPELDAGTLLDRLRLAGWLGEIVGPHGSGKSTLLATLRDALSRDGRSSILIELHDGQRRFPIERLAPAVSPCMVLVDGYEQLGLWSRWQLKRTCRHRGLGLVVTSHRPTGMPTLYRTHVDVPLARRVVDHLLADHPQAVPDAALSRSLAENRYNLREVLFDLYDWYENRG